MSSHLCGCKDKTMIDSQDLKEWGKTYYLQQARQHMSYFQSNALLEQRFYPGSLHMLTGIGAFLSMLGLTSQLKNNPEQTYLDMFSFRSWSTCVKHYSNGAGVPLA